jgi:MFS family permease
MAGSTSSLSATSARNKSFNSKEEIPHVDFSNEERGNIPSTVPVKEKSTDDPYLVQWNENDPENPYNWSTAKRSWMTFQLGMLAMVGSLASSITAPAMAVIGEDLGMSSEVTVLTVSLYVLGFIFGPCIWAPVSEIWGRRWSILPPLVGLTLFSIGSAASKSAASLLITRFLGGFFGSSPVSNVTAGLGDIWQPKTRGTAMGLYAVCVIGGLTLGPVIGSAITVTKSMGWRWTE